MAIAQDDTDQPPLIEQPSSHRIGATFGHLADRLSEPTHERPTSACPPRRVKQHDGLRSFEAKVETPLSVAVGDPGIACEQAALLVPPLVVGRLDPSRLPVVEVKMDHRQASLRRQRPRECALPGPCYPDDEHAAPDGPGCLLHLLSFPETPCHHDRERCMAGCRPVTRLLDFTDE